MPSPEIHDERNPTVAKTDAHRNGCTHLQRWGGAVGQPAYLSCLRLVMLRRTAAFESPLMITSGMASVMRLLEMAMLIAVSCWSPVSIHVTIPACSAAHRACGAARVGQAKSERNGAMRTRPIEGQPRYSRVLTLSS